MAHDQLLDDEVEQGIVAKGARLCGRHQLTGFFQQMLVLLAMGRQLLIAVLREDLLFEEEVLACHLEYLRHVCQQGIGMDAGILHVLEQAVGQQEELAVVRIDAGVAACVGGLPLQGAGERILPGGKQADPAPAMVLGLIHGLIGVVHQGLGVGTVIRIEGDPYAAGDAQRLLLKLEGVMQAVVQLVGDREGRGIRIGQHDDEFVPPQGVPPDLLP